VVAEADDKLQGFVSGYRIPGRQHTLFVWQVMVAPAARGQKLGTQMILHLLRRLGPSVRNLETTVTPDNQPSQALFQRLAKKLNTTCTTSPLFDSKAHIGGAHASEILWTIGPFASENQSAESPKETHENI